MTHSEELPAADRRVLLPGLVVGECSRWHDDRLWFSDMWARQVIAVDLRSRSEVVADVPTVGMAFDPYGELLMASMFDFRLVRLEAAGSLATYADLTTLSEHPWSDMVVDGRGNAYVGNIGLDFPAGVFAPAILALATPDGSVRRVADGIAFANGMVVTPDNSTLILAESYGIQLTAFDIEDDGSLSNRRTVGRTRGRSPGPDLPGCRGRHLVRRRPAQAMRPRPRGWRGARDGRARSRVLRLHVGRPHGRTLFLMAAEFTDAASMGSGARTGQVLAVPAPAPGARWP